MDTYYEKIYSCQGYNYLDFAPDNSVRIGGSCQASALTMAIRLISNSSSFKTTELKNSCSKYNLCFLNEHFSPKITYPAIPILLGDKFPNKQISLLVKKAKQDFILTKESNFFSKDSIKAYKDKPKLNNLVINFSVNLDIQINLITETLQKGGIVLPLLDSNRFYQTNLKETEGMMHVVLIDKYNQNEGFHIIDPDPGYLYEKKNFNNFKKKELRIKVESLNFREAQKYANRYHPLKDISYLISEDQLRNSLVGFTTIIC